MTSPELIEAVQRDRERYIDHDSRACLAVCATADCCRPSIADRIARFMRPATFPLMGGRS